MLSLAVKRFVAGLLFLYPVAIYFCVQYFGPIVATSGLIVILTLRFVTFRKLPRNPLAKTFDLVLVIFLIQNILNLYFQSPLVLRLYPFLMSSGAAFAFSKSLFDGRPLIEEFARLVEKNLQSEQIRYIRRLTWIWAIWLSFNSAIALISALTFSFEHWLLYNGMIFYVVTGLLVASDLVYRKVILKKRLRMQGSTHA